MDEGRGSEGARYRILVAAFGTIAGASGIISLIGWATGQRILAELEPGRVPMAPSTAMLFMLYGTILLLRAHRTLTRARYWTILVASAIGGTIALALVLLAVLGLSTGLEHLGFAISGKIGEAPLGYMSPVTAVLFIIVTLAFLASLPSKRRNSGRAVAAVAVASLVVVASIVLILAYFTGRPLFYSGNLVPPALTTSLALLSLGSGVLILSGQSLLAAEIKTEAHTRSAYLLIVVYVLLVAGIVVGGYAYYDNYEGNYKEQVERQLVSITDLKADDLAHWRADRLADGDYLYKNPLLTSFVKQYLNTPDDIESWAQIASMLGRMRSSHGYQRAALVDVHGMELISIPDTSGVAVSHPVEDIEDAIASKQVVIVDFHRHESDNLVYLTVLVPVLDDIESEPIGVILLQIDPGDFLYPLISLWPTPSDTAETLLVRREGNEVVFLNELRFQQGVALNLRFPLSQTSLPAAQAASGYEGVLTGTDYRGVPVIAATRAVPNSPWFVVSRIDISEVYAPVRRMLWVTVILVIALLAGVGAAVAFLWRQQGLRFYRERSQLADALKESLEFNRGILEDSPHPIVVRSADASISYVNPAVELLTGYRAADLIGKTDVFAFWDGLLPTPDKESIDGLVAGGQHRQEHKFLKLSGEPFWVEITSTTMKTDDQAHRYLSNWTDITERKRAEERVERLTGILRVLRDVNQLITRERDRVRLITQSCQLMRQGGYLFAWILLFDQERQFVAFAQSGGDKIGQSFTASLGQGEYPPCVRRILEAERPVAVCDDLFGQGHSCFARSFAENGSGLIGRLERQGKVYGTFAAYVHSDIARDSEALSLFEELAGDIAFALANMEKEEARVKAEQQLERSERKYSALVERSNDGIVTIQDGAVKFANSKMVEMTGIALEETIGRSFLDFISPADRAVVAERYARRMRGEPVPDRYEADILAADGKVVPVEISASLVEYENAPANMAIVRDITERKKAEESLRLERENYRNSMEMSSLGIQIVAVGGETLYVNPALLQLIGYSSLEEWNAAPLDRRLAPESAAFVAGVRERLLQGETVPDYQREVTMIRKDGQPRNVILYRKQMTWNGNMVSQVIYEDITERKKMQERLMVTDRLASVGELASGMAHELNNPLTSVIGFSELLLEKEIPSDIREDVELISREAKRTADVVKNMLTFARRHPSAKQPLDIVSLIGNVLQLRAYEHGVNNIQVATEFPDNMPKVPGDYFQLQQVLMNIIINAEYFMKAAHARGTLTIKAESTPENVRIMISDDGPGITPENLGHVFDPFFTTKEVGKGTGLGLSICHGIVAEHGGRIFAESEVGKGATFIIELPLGSEEEISGYSISE